MTDKGPSTATQWLFGKVLVCGAYDQRGIATAMLKRPLEEICRRRAAKLRLCLVDSSRDMIRHDANLGLALWTITEESSLTEACSAICDIRLFSPDTICCTLVDTALGSHLLALVEAGAQIVASQLPSLETAVCRAAMQASLSSRGFHPLTTDLTRLLPWHNSLDRH